MSDPVETKPSAYLRVGEDRRLHVSVWQDGAKLFEAESAAEHAYPADPAATPAQLAWADAELHAAGIASLSKWDTPFHDNPDPALGLNCAVAPASEVVPGHNQQQADVSQPEWEPPSKDNAERDFEERVNRTRPDRPVWLSGENQAGSLPNDPHHVTAHATADEARLAVADQIKDFADDIMQERGYTESTQELATSADAWGDAVKHDADGDFRHQGEFVVSLNDTSHTAQEFWVHKSTVAEHFGPDWRADEEFAEFIVDAPVEPAVYVSATKGVVVDDELVTETGWVNPGGSRTDLYENREDVAPLYIGDDPNAAAEAVEEYMGGVDTPERGRGTFYAADAYEVLETGENFSYAAHADGYTPAQLAVIETRLDPKVAAATPLTEGQLESLRSQAKDVGMFDPKAHQGHLDSRDALQARMAPPSPKLTVVKGRAR